MIFLMQRLPTGKMNSMEIIKYLKNQALLTESTLPYFEQLVQEYPWFQTAWMLYLKNLHNLNHPDFQTMLNRCAIRIGNRKELKKFVENRVYDEESVRYFNENISRQFTGGADKSGEGNEITSPNTDNLRLIDNFLASEARFKPVSNDISDDMKPDHAEKATAESPEIITETFAGLLLTQGKYEKALQAYEKLSLKYPEKSIYFATRIQEIIGLINKK
jgi:hypothetical protein